MDLSSPVTGLDQTGLTSPTFTLAADTAPTSNGKQFVVTALGGTQTGVVPNSLGAPFTITYFRPSAFKTAVAGILAAAGIISNIPMNVFTLVVRKAVKVNEVGGVGIARAEIKFHVPVNATEEDLVSLKSMISALGGVLTQDPDQWFENIHGGTL